MPRGAVLLEQHERRDLEQGDQAAANLRPFGVGDRGVGFFQPRGLEDDAALARSGKPNPQVDALVMAASGEPTGERLVPARAAEPQLPHVECADDERCLDRSLGTPFLHENRGAHGARVEGDEEFGFAHLTGVRSVEREAHPQVLVVRPDRPAGIDSLGRAELILHFARRELTFRGNIPGIHLASVGKRENEPHRLPQELGLRSVAALGIEAELGDDGERGIGAEVVDRRSRRRPVAAGVRGLRHEVSKLGRSLERLRSEGHACGIAHFRAGDRAQQLGGLFGNIPRGHALPAVARAHELPVR